MNNVIGSESCEAIGHIDEVRTHLVHAPLQCLVDEFTFISPGMLRRRQRDLVLDDQCMDPTQTQTKVIQGIGIGLATERGKNAHRFPGELVEREPIQLILQQTRNGSVVFGRADDEAISSACTLLEFGNIRIIPDLTEEGEALLTNGPCFASATRGFHSGHRFVEQSLTVAVRRHRTHEAEEVRSIRHETAQ